MFNLKYYICCCFRYQNLNEKENEKKKFIKKFNYYSEGNRFILDSDL